MADQNPDRPPGGFEHEFDEWNIDETEKRITPKADSERTLDAEESIGKAIERFGEEVGWDGVSEWAREHLEVDEKSN